jgi:hypothetical protein
MQPFFTKTATSPLPSPPLAYDPARFAAPANFRSAAGVKVARMLQDSERLFARSRYLNRFKGSAGSSSATGAAESREPASRRAGKAFESRIQRRIAEILGQSYLPGPWFSFNCGSNQVRLCQPDGILELPRSVLIVEIKHQHTVSAWFQLRQLYQPVVECALRKPATVVEIFKTGDVLLPFPEPLLQVKGRNLREAAEGQMKEFLICFADQLESGTKLEQFS